MQLHSKSSSSHSRFKVLLLGPPNACGPQRYANTKKSIWLPFTHSSVCPRKHSLTATQTSMIKLPTKGSYSAAQEKWGLPSHLHVLRGFYNNSSCVLLSGSPQRCQGRRGPRTKQPFNSTAVLPRTAALPTHTWR